MDKHLIIFIGLQASGKTSFYVEKFSNDYVHINLDTLKYRHREKLAFSKALLSGQGIVVDNTNPTKMDRKRYISKAVEYGYHISVYFFQSRLKECISRNMLRERVVPTIRLVHCSNLMELPVKSEGFDEMYFVRIINRGFEVIPWIEE